MGEAETVRIQGERLRELREHRGWSQEQLASLVGVSQGTISHWEKSEGRLRTANLVALARLLGCSIDYLLGLSDRRFPDDAEAIRQGKLVPVKLLVCIRREGSVAPVDQYLVLGLQNQPPDTQRNDLILAQSLGGVAK